MQVKELLNQQDAVDASEHAGPLAEIEFWRERSVDLSGIRSQLDDAAVSAIVSVLEYAKSSYLAPFLSLRNLIHREAVAAEDNLKFLLCLEEPCQQLATAHPQVRQLLPVSCCDASGSLSQHGRQGKRIHRLAMHTYWTYVTCAASVGHPGPAAAHPQLHPHGVEHVALLQHARAADGAAAQAVQRDHQPLLLRHLAGGRVLGGRGRRHGGATAEHGGG